MRVPARFQLTNLTSRQIGHGSQLRHIQTSGFAQAFQDFSVIFRGLIHWERALFVKSIECTDKL